MIFSNITESIGGTPLLELSRIHSGFGRLFGKMEYINPGGSVKDRIAIKILEDAYKAGDLKKGQLVVEMTSGNTGAGLAIACNILGNPFHAFISSGQSLQRRKMLKAFGANVHSIQQVSGTLGKVTGSDILEAEAAAKKFAQKNNGFYVDQFRRLASVTAHYGSTGPEIWADLKGEVDAFVSMVGSGGTFIGTSTYLKEKRSLVKCYTVEPKGCEILAGKAITKTQHLLQGTGYGIIPPHWNTSIADGYISVSDKEAADMKERLARIEGVYVGYSSAANVVASVKLIKSDLFCSPPNIVTVLCDTGFKYD